MALGKSEQSGGDTNCCVSRIRVLMNINVVLDIINKKLMTRILQGWNAFRRLGRRGQEAAKCDVLSK